MNWQQLVQQICSGDIKSLARAISLVENEYAGYHSLLKLLPGSGTATITGITGPPGAGKSTLVDALVGLLVNEQKKCAVLCIDPSSPFKKGALLGDRIRMSEWYNHPNVFIRSLATRGSLGGLHPKIIEITDIIKAAAFDHIIIETVGVGQSEVEIAGLADTTVVVLVPEAGDEIQTMKAGLMEVADIFVVNKADRPGADLFIKNLRTMLTPDFHRQAAPIIKSIAPARLGIQELLEKIIQHESMSAGNGKKEQLLTEKGYQLIQRIRMKDIDRQQLQQQLEKAATEKGFNLYAFIDAHYH